MNLGRIALAVMISTALGIVGCSSSSKPETAAKAESKHSHEHKDTPTATSTTEDDEVKKAIGELDVADRALAMAQKFCPVTQESMLGSMGKPHKVMVDGQPVFLCCEACEEDALKDPKATLAIVAKLKEAAKTAK